MYSELPASAQPAAQTLLASRESSAAQLLAAIDAGTIKSQSISADTIDKLRLYPSPAVAKVVARQFPSTPADAAATEEKIARYARLVRAGGGNPLEGKKLFYGKASCATCHTVFNKGGHIGPDLTSYDRANLDSMLLAIVNPSAEIREGFENYLIQTTDGRTLDGFKVDENNQVFVLRGVDGQNNVIALNQIKVRRVSPRSLMPEGLLDALSEREVKDLFAFLSSTTPPM
jgi:putative heme-binding domain-containing protein